MIQNYVFIGIGGIGMSALAQYYLSLGKTVWGYDRNRTWVTDMLVEKGAIIQFDDSELPLFSVQDIY